MAASRRRRQPADGRSLRYQRQKSRYAAQLHAVDALKAELDRRRPLTPAELQRLREEFLVEYTYNSNAIEGNTLTLQETALVLEGITIDQKPLKDHLEAVDIGMRSSTYRYWCKKGLPFPRLSSGRFIRWC